MQKDTWYGKGPLMGVYDQTLRETGTMMVRRDDVWFWTLGQLGTVNRAVVKSQGQKVGCYNVVTARHQLIRMGVVHNTLLLRGGIAYRDIEHCHISIITLLRWPVKRNELILTVAAKSVPDLSLRGRSVPEAIST